MSLPVLVIEPYHNLDLVTCRFSSNQIWCASCSHGWGVQQHKFFCLWPFVKIIQGLASATIIVCIVTSLIAQVMLTLCIREIPKRVLLQTVKTQIKCSIMLHFIRVYTVCKGKNDFQTKEYNIFFFNL